MLDMSFDIISFIIKAILCVLTGIALCIVPFILSALFFFIVYTIKGKRLKKRSVQGIKVKNHNFLVKLFILFPRQFILDLFNKNPDNFPLHGLHLFCGEQGSGKTMAMIHFAQQIKNNYPLCQVSANFQVHFADSKTESIDDIVFKNNGELGQVQMIDEIQTWFNSLESKNFPIDMIQEICQQRKQRKMILGTSQVFTRVAKAIREQVTLIYEPMTILSCLTIVRVYKPKLDDNGTETSRRRVKMYFFVHTEELRNCYDTYEKIERLNKKGFKDKTEQLGTPDTPVVNVTPTQPVKKFTRR